MCVEATPRLRYRLARTVRLVPLRGMHGDAGQEGGGGSPHGQAPGRLSLRNRQQLQLLRDIAVRWRRGDRASEVRTSVREERKTDRQTDKAVRLTGGQLKSFSPAAVLAGIVTVVAVIENIARFPLVVLSFLTMRRVHIRTRTHACRLESAPPLFFACFAFS